MTDDMPTFTTAELLEFARSLRSEIRRSGLDYRVNAAADLVEQLTEACLREAAGTTRRITPVLGGEDEPRVQKHLVAQL